MPAQPEIAPALLAWWERHGRKDLPWQQQPTPYRVWVSEIMLQQTQVATVLRYYPRFMAAFPSVAALAAAAEDAVLHLWSGLGYYARARNLHRAARQVRDAHDGEVPTDFDTLLGLPGIGRSTAGAILALSRDEPWPILDGNAKRVLARVFGVRGWPGETAVARELWAHAERCTPATGAARYTQAIMDLGAGLCSHRRPACAQCPLAEICAAHASGEAEALPGRRPARARPRRHTAVLLVQRPDGHVLLEKRPAEGIWGGLWGLPETAAAGEAERVCREQLGVSPAAVETRAPVQHGFTHFELEMTPVLVRLADPPTRCMESGRWLWYNPKEPAAVGLAAPVARLLAGLEETA